jgi:hypothetical protein
MHNSDCLGTFYNYFRTKGVSVYVVIALLYSYILNIWVVLI